MKRGLFFFDLDGTLEDSRTDMVQSVNRVRQQFQLSHLPFESAVKNVTRGMNELYHRCFADMLSLYEGALRDELVERIRTAYEEDYYNHVLEQTTPYGGIREVLMELSALGHLVVITNKPEKISRHLLEKLGFLRYISLVKGGDSCPKTKPDPLPLELAMAELKLTKETCSSFMIGDSAADVQAGKSFGATTIWCAWGYTSHPGELVPDLVARSPYELPELIKLRLS